jgi:hypothetical protein
MKNEIILIKKENKYHDIIKKALQILENEYVINVCFSGLVRSIPADLNTKESDLDMFVFYDGKEDNLMSCSTEINNVQVETNLINIKLLNYISFTNDELKKYFPSFKDSFLDFRKNFNYTILSGEENCKLSSLVTRLIFNRHIWDDNGFINLNYDLIKNQLLFYDFIKCLYIWAEGRLYNYLSGDNIQLRIYLYTIHEILTIDQILKTKCLPPVAFLELLETCDNQYIYDEMIKYYHINKQSVDKFKVLISENDKLNAYISTKLNEFRPQIDDIYKNNRDMLFQI